MVVSPAAMQNRQTNFCVCRILRPAIVGNDTGGYYDKVNYYDLLIKVTVQLLETAIPLILSLSKPASVCDP